MTQKDDAMSGRTESIPLKVTPEMHAHLTMIASASSGTIQDFVRDAIQRAVTAKIHEYTVAARILRGEEIAGKSRGNRS